MESIKKNQNNILLGIVGGGILLLEGFTLAKIAKIVYFTEEKNGKVCPEINSATKNFTMVMVVSLLIVTLGIFIYHLVRICSNKDVMNCSLSHIVTSLLLLQIIGLTYLANALMSAEKVGDKYCFASTPVDVVISQGAFITVALSAILTTGFVGMKFL
jgi:hypothetical protein